MERHEYPYLVQGQVDADAFVQQTASTERAALTLATGALHDARFYAVTVYERDPAGVWRQVGCWISGDTEGRPLQLDHITREEQTR